MVNVPAHMVEEDAVTVAVGSEFTVTVLVTVGAQPAVTVTTYPVFTVGLTDIVVVVAPVLHLYALPPLAVSVALCPLQIVSEGAAEIAGSGLTVTVLFAIALHWLALVTVTV